jgi:hypothetical protein
LLTKRNIFSSLELGFLLPATIIGLTLENVEDVEKVPQEPQGLTAEKGFGGRRHDRIKAAPTGTVSGSAVSGWRSSAVPAASRRGRAA